MTKKKKLNQHQAVWRGVSAAFIENSAFLNNYLRRFLYARQDIEGVMQETYLKAYRAEQAREIEQPKAFLFTIAKNLAVNELRKKSRQMTDYIDDSEGVQTLFGLNTVENEIEAEQSLGVYCDAVATLSKQCRRVYLLGKVDGLRHREIADRLGISLSSVEKHLVKGSLQCQAYIREHNGKTKSVTREVLE